MCITRSNTGKILNKDLQARKIMNYSLLMLKYYLFCRSNDMNLVELKDGAAVEQAPEE